jgi:hypothetical protein
MILRVLYAGPERGGFLRMAWAEAVKAVARKST